MRLPRRRKGRSFSQGRLTPLGYIGTVVILAVLFAALNFSSLPIINSSHSYNAQFTDAGGLKPGDTVVVAGLTVGSVDSISLVLGKQPHVKVGFTVTDSDVHLGTQSTADIGTITVLGTKSLEVQPVGSGTMSDGSTIPLARTQSPYDITDDLNNLTTKVTALDTTALAKSLSTVSSTFATTPGQLKAALTGVSRLSNTIGSRDAQLHTLLQHASNVTGVLASRNQQITLLLTDGSSLFRALNDRRNAVIQLFQNVSAVAQQINNVIGDQKSRLKPALNSLNQVLALLNHNQANIEKILTALGPYVTSLGESVGSGPFFNVGLENLQDPASLPIFPNGVSVPSQIAQLLAGLIPKTTTTTPTTTSTTTATGGN